MTTLQKRIVWVAGAVVLFGLNIRRDINFASKRYDWKPVIVKTLHQSVSNAGVIEAIQVAEIKSEVDEIVEKKHVQEGQAVRKGQMLVELSRTKTQLEFEQTRNSYLNAESDYKRLTRELEVQKKLLKNLAVSRSQVEETAQSKEKAKSALDIAARQLEIAKEKLDNTSVRSPLNGVVLKDFTKVGDKITPGKEIITVGDISKFIVKTKVDELDIRQVSTGQRVWIEADAFPGQRMEGAVTHIATQAEREAFAKLEVVIDITNPGPVELKHNLSVRVHILTGDIPNSVGIPAKSILSKKGNIARVVIRNKLHMIREKNIEIGRVAGEEVEVTAGLKPGVFVGVEMAEVDQP